MTHPCADHMSSCDHCYRCESGECCRTPLPGSTVYRTPVVAQPDPLHEAVLQDASRAGPSLSQLVRAEGLRPSIAGLLLPGPPAASIPHHSRKEAEDVYVPVVVSRSTA